MQKHGEGLKRQRSSVALVNDARTQDRQPCTLTGVKPMNFRGTISMCSRFQLLTECGLEFGLPFFEGLVHEILVGRLSIVGGKVQTGPHRVRQLTRCT